MSTAATPHDSIFAPHAACPGYTGGQYAMVRVFMALMLGLYLLRMLHWLTLPDATMPFGGDAPWILTTVPNVFALTGTTQAAVVCVLVASIGLCMLLAIGWFDRVAAALLWYVLASMHMYASIRWLQVSIVFIGWALLAHAMIGGLPYGTWKGRGQTDPRGGWAMPRDVCGACWFMLAVGYVVQGVEQVTNGAWLDGRILSGVLPMVPASGLSVVAWVVTTVGLAFPAIALVRRARPVLWAWTLIVHQAVLLSTLLHSTNLGMIMLHLLCFDPSWIPPRKAAGRDTVFFDGQCGLCHRMVRLALSEDIAGNLRFAPLHGETFEQTLSEQQRTNLPDSVVVYTAEGQMLTHSAAVIRIMQRLGGLWVILADVVGLAPRVMRDPVYRLVAKIRYRLFGSAKQACPLMPPELRERFQF